MQKDGLLDADSVSEVLLACMQLHYDARAMPLQVYSFGEGSFGALGEEFRASAGGSSKSLHKPDTQQQPHPSSDFAGLPCTQT